MYYALIIIGDIFLFGGAVSIACAWHTSSFQSDERRAGYRRGAVLLTTGILFYALVFLFACMG
jgi:hypothetical protein